MTIDDDGGGQSEPMMSSLDPKKKRHFHSFIDSFIHIFPFFGIEKRVSKRALEIEKISTALYHSFSRALADFLQCYISNNNDARDAEDGSVKSPCFVWDPSGRRYNACRQMVCHNHNSYYYCDQTRHHPCIFQANEFLQR